MNLTEFDCDYITKMVQDNDCEYINHDWRAVRYKGRIFKVAYSKKRHQIVTVLAIN